MLTPDRVFRVLSRITAECHWADPAATFTVIVTDTPPQVINSTAGELGANSARQSEVEKALRATPAASSLEAGVNAGLATLPRRFIICTDLNFPTEQIAAVVNARDPGNTMMRLVQFWCTYEERDAGNAKMMSTLKFLHGGGGVAPDPRKP